MEKDMPNVLIKEKNKSFLVAYSGILFYELKKQNEILPHGCLAGSCGACVIKIIKGNENLSKESAVEADTLSSLKNEAKFKNQNIRLSCRVKVLGDVEVETFI